MDTLIFFIFLLNNIAWMLFHYYMIPDNNGNKKKLGEGISKGLMSNANEANRDTLKTDNMVDLLDISLGDLNKSIEREDKKSKLTGVKRK